MPTARTRSASKDVQARASGTRRARPRAAQRAELVAELGEQVWALLSGGSLPVPYKLRAAFEALRAHEAEAAATPEPKKKSLKTGSLKDKLGS